MSDKYIKLSQINPSSLDNILPDDNQVFINGLSDNGDLLNLSDAAGFVTYKNMLFPDSVALTLLHDINTVTFNHHINQVGAGESRKLYVETNNKAFRHLDINSNEENITTQFTIYKGNQEVNSLIFSPLVLNSSGQIIQNKDLITSFSIFNQNITSLELNLPSCNSLLIHEPNLMYLNLAPEMKLSSLTMMNSYICGTFEINLQSNIEQINLAGNVIHTLTIRGLNGTYLNKNNCILLPQKADRLSYVKFIDCSVSADLISLLEQNGVVVETE